jgi:hypothetical protein
VDHQAFRQQFDRISFEFQHHLANHPLFALPRLIELARSTHENRPEDIHMDAGDVHVGQRWSECERSPFSVVETLERIQTCGAWIILKRANLDPDYGKLLRQCLDELWSLSGVDPRRVMMQEEIILFITSPRRISTYHIDRECNFLLQIQGDKDAHVFDRNDRQVLPEEEIEKFWSVDHNAAKYKPELEGRARVYRLAPGKVIHIPVNCPHWLQNGDNISVSMSVNFQFRDWYRANVYRANYALRRLGLHPRPPGQSNVIDSMKSCSVIPALWAKRALYRIRH